MKIILTALLLIISINAYANFKFVLYNNYGLKMMTY
jgi:hypothetical protein